MNIPDLPIDAVVDKEGKFTDVGKSFFQQLTSQLQIYFSNEGLVAPTQPASNITIIQNNTNLQGQFTCGFGRQLYNSTANSIQFSINNGAGIPIFKTVPLI